MGVELQDVTFSLTKTLFLWSTDLRLFSQDCLMLMSYDEGSFCAVCRRKKGEKEPNEPKGILTRRGWGNDEEASEK